MTRKRRVHDIRFTDEGIAPSRMTRGPKSESGWVRTELTCECGGLVQWEGIALREIGATIKIGGVACDACGVTYFIELADFGCHVLGRAEDA